MDKSSQSSTCGLSRSYSGTPKSFLSRNKAILPSARKWEEKFKTIQVKLSNNSQNSTIFVFSGSLLSVGGEFFGEFYNSRWFNGKFC